MSQVASGLYAQDLLNLSYTSKRYATRRRHEAMLTPGLLLQFQFEHMVDVQAMRIIMGGCLNGSHSTGSLSYPSAKR